MSLAKEIKKENYEIRKVKGCRKTSYIENSKKESAEE